MAPPPELSGYTVDDLLIKSWTKIFGPLNPSPILDIPSLITVAASLHHDIDYASARVFHKWKYPDPRGVRWWNQDCTIALTLVYLCKGQPKKDAIQHLWKMIASSKHQWAHDFLHHATSNNLWEAVAWCKGQSIKQIPPLLTSNTTISHVPHIMSEVLLWRFFTTEGPQVSSVEPDDPAPLPVQDFPTITQEEIAVALAKTSNKSAPGCSSINYKLLKWAFASRLDRFLEIFNAAISFGYHPWKEAMVVVVPKPNKPDYSLPKVYQPISLLECCSKLLEKIVTKRILADAHTYDILPPTQFGSQDYHSAVDATMCLVHNTQATVKSNLIASVILFNIQGFFDNINIKRMVTIITNLGFAPWLCLWVYSFLSD